MINSNIWIGKIWTIVNTFQMINYLHNGWQNHITFYLKYYVVIFYLTSRTVHYALRISYKILYCTIKKTVTCNYNSFLR